MDRRTFLVSSVEVLATSSSATADQLSLRSQLIGIWSLTEAVTVKRGTRLFLGLVGIRQSPASLFIAKTAG